LGLSRQVSRPRRNVTGQGCEGAERTSASAAAPRTSCRAAHELPADPREVERASGKHGVEQLGQCLQSQADTKARHGGVQQAADDYASERSEAALDAIDQGAAEHEGHVQARQCDDAEDQQEEDPKVGRVGQVQPFHGGRALLWEESHGACRNMPPHVMFERYRAKNLK